MGPTGQSVQDLAFHFHLVLPHPSATEGLFPEFESWIRPKEVVRENDLDSEKCLSEGDAFSLWLSSAISPPSASQRLGGSQNFKMVQGQESNLGRMRKMGWDGEIQVVVSGKWWGELTKISTLFSLLRQQYLIYDLQKLMTSPNSHAEMDAEGAGEVGNSVLLAVVEELRKKNGCQKILVEATRKFQIKQYNILNLTIEKVLQIYQILKNKFYCEQAHSQFCDQWYDNELRLFIWLFVCYSHLYKKNPEDMTKKDWSEFSRVFEGKKPFLFEYQARIIRKMNKKTKKWTSEEDQCLNHIIKHFSTLLDSMQPCKWSEVTKRLFIESNRRFFRTPKQCRQRWMNHLDPVKLKSKWTPSQDFALITFVLKEGKKWAMIAKEMGNIRTEHMVKNRYNSLLRAEMKKHDDAAEEMRIIKKILNRIRYSMEVKNNPKPVAAEVEKAGSGAEVECLQANHLNNGFRLHDEDEMEAFEDILEFLKKEEPDRRTVNLMQEWEENMKKDENEGLNFDFDYKPTYLDYI